MNPAQSSSELVELVLKLEPCLGHLAALLPLGYGTYGGFSSQEARDALAYRDVSPDAANTYLRKWRELGLFSQYISPFRPDLPEGAWHLTDSAKEIAEAVKEAAHAR